MSQNKLGQIKVNDHDKPDDFDISYPCEATRVWGLANYWNYINYFGVYKPLINADWDSVLYSQISDFISARDAEEYNLAVLKTVAFTDDNHSIVRSKSIDQDLFGAYVPNFRMKKIGDTFIVTKHRTSRNYVPSGTLIKQGDILYSLNGIAINELYDSLKNYFAASNEWSKSRNVNPYILCSFMVKNQIVFSRDDKMDTIEIYFSKYYDYNAYEDSINSLKKRWICDERKTCIFRQENHNFS
ncbi:MAG: hypothetical protein LBV02_03680 [Bacteroidales bacterium]|nr:hypothetical protein [Bacteroidales bacterium]